MLEVSGVKLKFSSNTEGCDVLEIELDEAIEPKALTELDSAKLRSWLIDKQPRSEILVISGRAPIWLYAFLVHEVVHLWKVVAVYDPKLNGAVIIASHKPEYFVGDIVYVKRGDKMKDELSSCSRCKYGEPYDESYILCKLEDQLFPYGYACSSFRWRGDKQ